MPDVTNQEIFNNLFSHLIAGAGIVENTFHAGTPGEITNRSMSMAGCLSVKNVA